MKACTTGPFTTIFYRTFFLPSFVRVLSKSTARALTITMATSNTSPVTRRTVGILSQSCHERSQSLHNGSLTCVELMEATLDHIENTNPTCNAIIMLRPREQLMVEAAAADALLQKKQSKGWLHGIPMAIKDLSNVKGLPTTMGGSPLLQKHESKSTESEENNLAQGYPPAKISDPHVEHLLAAGAIILGKTNTPEFGLGSHTYNPLWGTTLNPLDTRLSAGGSSGGAAAALASDMLCVADGSDMMGSLRNPAGWNCDVYSLRPTAGIMETGKENPRNPLAYPISTAGPMARTVEDVSRLAQVMSNGAIKHHQSSSVNNKKVKVAWLGDWNGAYPFEDGILDLCRSTMQRVMETKLQWQVDDIYGENKDEKSQNEETLKWAPFDTKKLWTSWTTIRAAVVSHSTLETLGLLETCNNNKDESKLPCNMRPELRWEVVKGMQTSDGQLRHAASLAAEWSQYLEELFETYDIVVMPTAQVWPFPAEQRQGPTKIAGKTMETYHAWMEIAIPVSLAGLPCVTVPAGLGCPPEQLPMGLQLAGRRGEDARLLQLAEEYEREFQVGMDLDSIRFPPK